MGVTRVREHLVEHGWTGEILEFSESSATVELAALKVGTDPERIAKTLGFYDPDSPGRAVLVVAAGDAKVNSGRFKRRFGGKPRMLQADDVRELTGHPIGGVCPFANPEGTRVFLDESLRRFETVFPAAGTTASAVEIPVPALESLARAEGWVDIATGWRAEEAEHADGAGQTSTAGQASTAEQTGTAERTTEAEAAG